MAVPGPGAFDAGFGVLLAAAVYLLVVDSPETRPFARMLGLFPGETPCQPLGDAEPSPSVDAFCSLLAPGGDLRSMGLVCVLLWIGAAWTLVRAAVRPGRGAGAGTAGALVGSAQLWGLWAAASRGWLDAAPEAFTCVVGPGGAALVTLQCETPRRAAGRVLRDAALVLAVASTVAGCAVHLFAPPPPPTRP